MKLELGLIKLSELANADQLLFWGKVTTTASPYYIAVAIDFKGHYAFPHKKFYYRYLPSHPARTISSSPSCPHPTNSTKITQTSSIRSPSRATLRMC